ncbi:IclR family transcriptional regulator [Bordetella petrii]|uniref:Transcriptional regulator, IclR family n=1 Tax=Bordetella petrii (strain ATCC BAA-461 / DSM 12804 / CCUG 43448 / CIP 107267 / Se-1111R) TaxID=340100 RepID=A9I336_BORPD|nr:IclR family transcriptional regulator [Bordetella petrii]CAP44126.1 transcriptional regulator, IclR family [Bordetella petrii]
MPTLVSAAARALAVFETFAREKRELSNSELAKLLNLPDSSCLDLVYTLHHLGYLVRCKQTRRYYPSGRLMTVAEHIGAEDPIIVGTQDALDFLAERTGETAYVGCVDGAAVKVVAVKDGRHMLRYVLAVGQRVALHASAMGKALLGMLPVDQAADMLGARPLRKLTDTTVVDIEQLLASVECGRRRGWYETRGEGEPGADAFAVSGMLGIVPIAISISGPSDRFQENEEAYVRLLLTVSENVFGARCLDIGLSNSLITG